MEYCVPCRVGLVWGEYEVFALNEDAFVLLPAGLTNLKYLYWSNCGLPQVAVTVISGYTQLITLDISANQLTDYPNFSTLVGLNTLTTYIMTWNNIVSCALPYMNKFGENNILPQRTGNNWWCP